jgi:hypothetical protein
MICLKIFLSILAFIVSFVFFVCLGQILVECEEAGHHKLACFVFLFILIFALSGFGGALELIWGWL